MTDNERIENARAQREAEEAMATRSTRGPVARALQAAMARYLAAEQYREREAKPNARRARVKLPKRSTDQNAGPDQEH